MVRVCYLIQRFFLGLLLFVQTGCASYLGVSSEMARREKIGEIKESLAAVRGLKFINEVPVLVERDVIQERLEARLLEDYGEEKLKNTSLAYAKLGLFPRAVDLKKSLRNLYTARALGFYDPKAMRVVLLKESREMVPSDGMARFVEGDLDESTLAHELTHALQDQHFSLRDRLRPSSNDDKTLAFRSLIEGDAVLTELAYLFGGVDQLSPAQINQALQSSSEQLHLVRSNIPAAIAHKVLFQYKVGASFVYRVLREKGWPGINLLYSSPPLSTAQMLHPEKYFDLPDPPTRIDFKNLSLLFPPGWTEIENNTLGELMVHCLSREFLSKEEAEVVANGWGGDRFVAFRRGDEVSFIWTTVWDSPEDAAEFFEGYDRILSKKYPQPQLSNFYYIEQREDRVVVVEGLERAHVKEHIEKIWQGMELKKEPFERPFLLLPMTNASQ